MTRTAFGAVPGLTQNQSAAGGGIEAVYSKLPGPGVDPSTTNAFDQLVSKLFTIDNAADYATVLDQLAGAQYAQQLQSVIWSTRELNQTITDRMECLIDGTSWQAGGGEPKPNAAEDPGMLPAGTMDALGPGPWLLGPPEGRQPGARL